VSQEINLRRDSDDNGEWAYPNTAPIPSLPLSRKRPLESEEVSNDSCPRNESSPENKTVTGSTDFAIGLELADEVKAVSPHNRKRRGVVKVERSGKNDAAGECALILKGDHAIKEDAGSEDGEIAEHHESHEGIAAAVSHPMSLDSQQTRGHEGSAGKHSQKLLTFEPPSNASGRQGRVAWEDFLRELADYRKIHGHCDVPKNYSENTQLGDWVRTQRKQYRFHQKGKPSSMTSFRKSKGSNTGFTKKESHRLWPAFKSRHWKAWLSNGTATASPFKNG
jgi:hypothetical protein